MEQQPKTRSIKLLLIVNRTSACSSFTTEYYRLIDPTKEEQDMLTDAHGKILHGDHFIPGETVNSMQQIQLRLGHWPNGWTLEKTRETLSINNIWVDSAVDENSVRYFMGWDRVYVMGIMD